MKYKKIIKATFLERPNRFVAYCLIENEIHRCHVKNTGRCKELLMSGVTVYLEEGHNPNRKTKYSVVSVEKDGQIINIDSQSPNLVVFEALQNGFVPLGVTGEITKVKKEVAFSNSRFDIYLETTKEKGFIEIKGVTLKEGKIAKFPDAPTTRGTKHLLELIKAKQEGYFASAFFLLQMTNCSEITPNVNTDPKFSKALQLASANGVIVQAFDSIVTPSTIRLNKNIPVHL